MVLGVRCLVFGPWLRGCLVACLIGCYFFAFLTETRTGARVVSALWKCPVPDLQIPGRKLTTFVLELQQGNSARASRFRNLRFVMSLQCWSWPSSASSSSLFLSRACLRAPLLACLLHLLVPLALPPLLLRVAAGKLAASGFALGGWWLVLGAW